MRFQLVVFDLDGTLIDSRRDIADAANALLVECGASPIAEEQIATMVGDGAAVLVSRAFAAAGIPQPPDALARFLAIYDARLVVHTRPYDGVERLLEDLRPRTQLAVLTNKPLGAARAILAALDLERFFAPSRVLGGDGPLPRKPDPAGLAQLMAAAGGVSAGSTLMVGDSVVDWRTASAAGTSMCVARYGFGFCGFPADLMRPADLVADTPEQVGSFVS